MLHILDDPNMGPMEAPVVDQEVTSEEYEEVLPVLNEFGLEVIGMRTIARPNDHELVESIDRDIEAIQRSCGEGVLITLIRFASEDDVNKQPTVIMTADEAARRHQKEEAARKARLAA